MKIFTTFILVLVFGSCNKTDKRVTIPLSEEKRITKKSNSEQEVYNHTARPEFITGDFDGDKKIDTVYFTKHLVNGKYGLRLVFANHKIDTLGMGKDVVGQEFDDIEWAGIFKKVPGGELYAENIDEDGAILTEDQIPADAWIKIPNDGIFIHEVESCGGGIIYIDKGEYKWMQQE